MVRYIRPHGRFAHCSCKNAAWTLDLGLSASAAGSCLQCANRPFWPLVSKYTIPHSTYSWTSFSRIMVQPNFIFPKYHLPERTFGKVTLLSRNCMEPNVISPNTMWSYEYLPCYSKYHKSYVIMVFVPLNAFSGKSCSAKQLFGKMAFGLPTIQEDGVWLNDDWRKKYSAKWRFEMMTFG